MSDWISIKDRYPLAGQIVLLRHTNGIKGCGRIEEITIGVLSHDQFGSRFNIVGYRKDYYYENNWTFVVFETFSRLDEVTHWMPLPSVPADDIM